MKIKHRAVAIGAVGAMALGLAACSGGGESAPSGSAGEITGTVTGIFDSQYKGALDPIIADFEKKYPGVQVQIDYQGGDLGQVVLTQLQAGTAPDVLLAFPGGKPNDISSNVVPLAKSGLIAPFEADWSSKIPDIWKSDVSYEDKLYAFPGALQPLSAIYNQTALDKHGLKAPTTLDEVYKLCTDAKAKGVYAYAQGLGDTAGPQMLSFGQAASLVYGADPKWDEGLASGKSTYPGSGWQTQLEIYKKMSDQGCFGEGALGRTRQQGADAVAQGQALGIVDVGAVLTGIQAAAPNDKFVVAPIPATNESASVTALPGYVLALNAQAKNPSAAAAFLKFAGSPEEATKYAKGFNSVPVVPNDGFTPSPQLSEFNKLVQSGKTARIATLQPEVQTTLNTGIQSMLLGKETPESIAQKLQNAYKK